MLRPRKNVSRVGVKLVCAVGVRDRFPGGRAVRLTKQGVAGASAGGEAA